MRRLPILAMLILSACSHIIYPTTAGDHAKTEQPIKAYVVWSNHHGAEQYAISIFLSAGVPVVERSRLQALLDEQRITLSHTRDEDVLKVGRMVGASHVLFIEVHGVAPRGPFEAPTPLQVGIRSVAVERGTVEWSGLAYYDEPSNTPERSAMILTHWAMLRAVCYGRWEEHTATQKGGCQEGAAPTARSAPVATRLSGTEPEIWTELRRMEKRNKP